MVQNHYSADFFKRYIIIYLYTHTSTPQFLLKSPCTPIFITQNDYSADFRECWWSYIYIHTHLRLGFFSKVRSLHIHHTKWPKSRISIIMYIYSHTSAPHFLLGSQLTPIFTPIFMSFPAYSHIHSHIHLSPSLLPYSLPYSCHSQLTPIFTPIFMSLPAHSHIHDTKWLRTDSWEVL